MVITEIFNPVDWDLGYGTVNKTVNKRGASFTGDIKLTLPGQSLKQAAFKCKTSYQLRLRDFLRQCRAMDQELIDAGLLDGPGWHEEVFEQLREKMIQHQKRNTTWDPKYMRFGIGRLPKFGPTPGYGPCIPGVVSGFDPGTGMMGVSVGRTTLVEELQRDGLSARQVETNTVAAGFIKHRKIEYADCSAQIEEMRAALRSAVKPNLPF